MRPAAIVSPPPVRSSRIFAGSWRPPIASARSRSQASFLRPKIACSNWLTPFASTAAPNEDGTDARLSALPIHQHHLRPAHGEIVSARPYDAFLVDGAGVRRAGFQQPPAGRRHARRSLGGSV